VLLWHIVLLLLEENRNGPLAFLTMSHLL